MVFHEGQTKKVKTFFFFACKQKVLFVNKISFSANLNLFLQTKLLICKQIVFSANLNLLL